MKHFEYGDREVGTLEVFASVERNRAGRGAGV